MSETLLCLLTDWFLQISICFCFQTSRTAHCPWIPFIHSFSIHLPGLLTKLSSDPRVPGKMAQFLREVAAGLCQEKGKTPVDSVFVFGFKVLSLDSLGFHVVG